MFTLLRKLLIAVVALFILVPSVILSQVKIKEKVEIKPQPQMASKRGVSSTASTGRFFNPPFFVWDTVAHQPSLTLSANVTVLGSITFGAEIGCGQYAKVYLGNYDIVSEGKTSSGSGCTPYNVVTPFTGDFTRASYPDVQMFTFDWQTADGVRQPLSGDESTISYSFSSYLRQGILPTSPPDVQVTATATATGNYFLPPALFDHWELRDNQTVLACNGSMGIIMSPTDGYGEPYLPVGISRKEAPVTVRVDSGGPYVFLRAPGQESTLVTTTLSDGCTLVFDATRGGFSGETKDVIVTVTGGGKSSSFIVTLMCASYNHLEVTALPRVLAAVDTSTVRVVARDINNQEITFTDDHTIMMDLSSPDVVLPPPSRWGPPPMPPLGNFIVSGGEAQPPPIFASYNVAKAGGVKYVPDTAMFGSKDSMKVVVSAQDMYDMSKNGSADLEVVKSTTCVHVAFDTSTVSPGGTTGLQFTRADGSSSGFPADQLFDVLIVSGGGTLVSSSDSGSVLIGTRAPVHYVAPAAIVGDSMVVGVSALAYSSGGGTTAGSQVSVAPMQNISNLKKLPRVAATQSLNKKAREAQIAAIAKLLEDSQCPSPAQLVVKKTEPELVVTTPDEKTQKITGDNPPKMPTPVIKAQLKNFDGGEVTFKWRITIKWTSGQGGWITPRNEDEKYESPEAGIKGSNSDIVDLGVNLEKYDMRGGEQVTVHVEASTQEGNYQKDLSNPFQIKGLNPDPNTVRSEISASAPTTVLNYVPTDTRMLQIIACKESAFKLAQFGTSPGIPLQGDPDNDDFGIMQINKPSNDNLIWDWKQNVAGGMVKFNEKKKTLADYIAAIQESRCWKIDSRTKKWTALQPTRRLFYLDPMDGVNQLPENPTQLTEEQGITELFQRYNGGVYYRWMPDDIWDDPTGPGAWVAQPWKNGGAYAKECMGYFKGTSPCDKN